MECHKGYRRSPLEIGFSMLFAEASTTSIAAIITQSKRRGNERHEHGERVCVDGSVEVRCGVFMVNVTIRLFPLHPGFTLYFDSYSDDQLYHHTPSSSSIIHHHHHPSSSSSS